MASNSLSLVLDDTSGAFQFGPRAWANSSLVQWYGGTSVFPDFAAGATSNSSSAVFGSFLMTFQGTSIAFVGNTPAAPSSQSIAVSIDGGAEYETSYDDPTPQSYLQWYQSPTLPEGTHTIAVNQVAGTSLDYAIVTVGPNTPLTGKTILVDNEDPAIQYSGGWTRNTDRFDAGNLPDGLPYHNSTHRSSTPGDIITFRFQGTSAQIYGIFSWFNIGILSATYTLDGTTVPQTYAVATNTPEFVSNQGEAANFLLFSYNNLPAGDHTLVINITRCVNQTFILDYITYSPSFLNLAAMPALPVLSPSSVSIVPTGSSATNTPTATSATTSTTSQVGQPGTLQTVSKKVPIAAIVGGVVGGILLIFAFLCLWIRIRRSKKESAKSLMQIEGDESSHAPSYNTRMPETTPSISYNSAYSPSGNVTITPFQDAPSPTQLRIPRMSDIKHQTNYSTDSRRGLSPTSSDGYSNGPSFYATDLSSRASTGPTIAEVAHPDLKSPDLAQRPPAYDSLSTRHISVMSS